MANGSTLTKKFERGLTKFFKMESYGFYRPLLLLRYFLMLQQQMMVIKTKSFVSLSLHNLEHTKRHKILALTRLYFLQQRSPHDFFATKFLNNDKIGPFNII
jgi:hypothetical protein